MSKHVPSYVEIPKQPSAALTLRTADSSNAKSYLWNLQVEMFKNPNTVDVRSTLGSDQLITVTFVTWLKNVKEHKTLGESVNYQITLTQSL